MKLTLTVKSCRTSVAQLSGLLYKGTFKWTNCAFSPELAGPELEKGNPNVEDEHFESGFNWENSALG